MNKFALLGDACLTEGDKTNILTGMNNIQYLETDNTPHISSHILTR